jgi:serine/threonine-protein kinase
MMEELTRARIPLTRPPGERLSDVSDRLRAALEGSYRIERQIGSGGMATVYLAEDLRHGREVALKVLRPDLADSLAAERFQREIDLAVRLNHPHIVTVFESGEADGLLYYSMVLVEGESLRDRIDREGQLPVDEVVRITNEAAAALKYAHDHGVVHRDVKPANILLHDGQALVADFGVAQAVSVAGGERLTRTGVAVGSPLYMSPEQASGVDALDGRSDQYSLACIVYEMLAGEPPLGGRTLQTIMFRRSTETPTSLQVIRSSVTPELEAVVFKALDCTPADRYADVVAFADALAEAWRAAARTTSTATGVAGPATSLNRAARRRRAVIGAGGLIIAAAAAFFGLRAKGGPPAATAADAPALAVLPFGFSGPTDDEHFLADQMTMKIIESLRRTGARTPPWISVSPYRDSAVSMRQVGSDLGVDYVLSGNLLSLGDELQLIVELQSADESLTIWSATFRGVPRDLAGFELSIAQTTIDSVAARMGIEVGGYSVTALTADPVADSLYTRALYLANVEYDPVHNDSIIDLTGRAIERDSRFAEAWALRGIHLIGRSRIFWQVLPDEVMPDARRHLERAIELEPDLSVAHEGLGWYYYGYKWDWRAALQFFDEAVRLDPNYAHARTSRAFVLVSTGRTEEAIAAGREAVQLEPHNALIGTTECWLLYLSGRSDAAVASCERVLREIDPENGFARAASFLIRVQDLASRDGPEARAQLRPLALQALSVEPPWGEFGPATWLAMSGDTARARAAIVEDKRRPGIRPLRIANQYAAIAEMDSAFAWLDRAIEARDAYLPEIRVRPEMANFRADPRYDDVLVRIGLQR